MTTLINHLSDKHVSGSQMPSYFQESALNFKTPEHHVLTKLLDFFKGLKESLFKYLHIFFIPPLIGMKDLEISTNIPVSL